MIHTVITATLTTAVGLLTLAALGWAGICTAALIRGALRKITTETEGVDND